MDEPLPWVLDDLDPSTTFDADIRQKVQDAINVLKGILQKNGIKEGTEEYKEKLAVGLFWLAAFPDKEALNGKIVDSKQIEKRKTILEHIKKDLENNGLLNFWGYLNANGGFRVEGDHSEEVTALDALKYKQGACTEKSNILYGIFRMAGIKPSFVMPESDYTFVEELKNAQGNLAKYWMGQLDNLPKGMSHMYIGNNFKDQLRFFDPSFFDSRAIYKSYYPQSLSQFLSMYIINRGGEWSKKGEFDKAIADFSEAIKINPKSDVIYYNRGLAWSKKGEFDKAIADFSEAIKINPKFDGAYLNRGVEWSEKGEIDKAIADFSEAIKINPKFDGAYLNRGLAWLEKGEIDKAIADFSEAIKINPKLDGAYLNRGLAWSEKGEFDKTIADYSEAIKLNPKSDNAYSNRGLAWSEKGEIDKAIADYSEAVKINPKSHIAYLNRGLAWSKKDEIGKAIADYSEAVKINPKFIVAYLNRGVGWLKKNEVSKASADFSNGFIKLSNMKFDSILGESTAILTEYWQKDAKMTVAMNTFAKDTEGLDMPKVESYFVLSYALWLAGKKDEAIEKFGVIEGAIIFNDRPSPSTKEFLNNMLAPIPPAMKKSPKVQKMLRSLEVKIKK